MPNLDFEFEVFCAVCGEGICNNCEEGKTKGRGMPFIRVKPCETCMSNAKEQGYDEGYDKRDSEIES